MVGAVGAVALSALLLPSYGAAQSTKYKKGDAVPLFANKVRPPPASSRAGHVAVHRFIG
jgi:hypothetical protein